MMTCVIAHAEPAPPPHPMEDCGLEPPGSPAWGPVPGRPHELSLRAAPPLIRRVAPLPAAEIPNAQQIPWGRSGEGFLAGKTVYLSPGHGFTFGTYGWRTQRGTTNGIVEDLVSAEAVQQYLARYLRQAGARVVSVREPDMNDNLVIVDDADRGAGYAESGPAGRFSDSTVAGWGRQAGPLTGQQNPFTLGKNRLLQAAARPDASATFTPTLPAAGEYNVYVSYSQFERRAPDAHFVVRHPGGEAHFRLDQRRHGGTWILLGRFYFDKGASPERGAVVVWNDSGTPDANISLDAVRFGGGMGLTDRGKGVSGRPRWEESARYAAQYNGAPPTVFDQADLDDHGDDVGTRSRFAAWDHEEGEDAVYLAWHTNAPNPGVGTSSYVYGPNPPDGSYNFTGTPGSDVMMKLVHDEIVGDLRRGWDPNWRDRGKYSAYFGEVNPRHNPETPAALIEVAFHDTPGDAQQLKQARFRQIVARAMYQGIAKFFAGKDGKKVALLPEPPASVCGRGVAPGEVLLTITPPEPGPAGLLGDPPAAYRVYRSRDGLSFDEGTDVAAQSAALTGLPPGETVYVRVAAVNAGGESLPSPLLAVRTRRDGKRAQVLLIAGYDRLDGGLLVSQDLGAWALGTVGRMLLDRMNDASYLAAHARALAALDVSFDACTRGAAAGPAGPGGIEGYALIDWQAGQSSQTPLALTPEDRAALSEHLRRGGRLLLSGSEVFWALGEKGDREARAFLAGLGVRLQQDDAGTRDVDAAAAGPFLGLPAFALDDGTRGGYRVQTPDVLQAESGAQVVLSYKGGRGGAAVAAPAERPAVFSLGFPLEAVYDEPVRIEIVRRVLAALRVAADGQETVPPDPELDDTTMMKMEGCSCEVGAGRPAGSRATGGTALGLLLLCLWRAQRKGKRRPPSSSA
jgi:N-acetylmuramoyl-L-alanine amidase